ncbi:MAG: Phosphate regulon transcriptional regulatory protein PhoB [bacterium ADurb.Bin212]|nr:MAG: Phosphate regulon transcriptional regulatory protein PhoB [bacterium ADurb.Bin212]
MRILLVDDDVMLSDLVVLVLQKNGGHEVEVLASADPAIERITEGDLHLVLTDWCVPGGGGQKIVDSAESAGLPVGIITGLSENEVPDFPVLQKPFRLGALQQFVTMLLGPGVAV